MDTYRVFERLSAVMNLEAAKAVTETFVTVLDEVRDTVTKADFSELQGVVQELAEAQKRTETAVRELTRGLTETRQMVGGLSDAVGYGLEDRAIRELPRVLAAEHGVTVKGRLVRRFVRYPDGKKDELNIFGEGERAGELVTVCGEAKARLSRKHVDALCRVGERLVQSAKAKHPLFLLMVSYSVEPEIEEYAAARAVTVIPSYLL